jgi:hypothetical protein
MSSITIALSLPAVEQMPQGRYLDRMHGDEQGEIPKLMNRRAPQGERTSATVVAPPASPANEEDVHMGTIRERLLIRGCHFDKSSNSETTGSVTETRWC